VEEKNMFEWIEVTGEGRARALMVWLHGLGADGYDLEPVAAALDLPKIRHVLLHAPYRPVTLNGGMTMRAWYDIASPDLKHREDVRGMQASALGVKAVIERLRAETGLPVMLGGFSQGGVVSLATAALGIGLSGVAVLSGYLPDYLGGVLETLSGVPVFMAHGRQDPVIPFDLASAGASLLRQAGVRLEWHAYDMPHAISLEEISDLRLALRAWMDRAESNPDRVE
jgi:phospholipase/carboxylesterase